MAERPADRDGSLVAEGCMLLDAQAGVRWKQFELTIDVLKCPRYDVA